MNPRCTRTQAIAWAKILLADRLDEHVNEGKPANEFVGFVSDHMPEFGAIFNAFERTPLQRSRWAQRCPRVARQLATRPKRGTVPLVVEWSGTTKLVDVPLSDLERRKKPKR